MRIRCILVAKRLKAVCAWKAFWTDSDEHPCGYNNFRGQEKARVGLRVLCGLQHWKPRRARQCSTFYYLHSGCLILHIYIYIYMYVYIYIHIYVIYIIYICNIYILCNIYIYIHIYIYIYIYLQVQHISFGMYAYNIW